MEYSPDDGVQTRWRSAYLDALVRDGLGAVLKGGQNHLTASALVFDPERRHVLLNHHRKAGLWGQFGGHLEPADESLPFAALREAREESGIDVLLLEPIAELHRHELPRAFGTCRFHLDVLYLAHAPLESRPRASAESVAVRWYPISELPENLMPDLTERIPRLAQLPASLRPRSGE